MSHLTHSTPFRARDGALLLLILLALSGCGPDASSTTYESVERCADGIDNTGDGLIDCASPDCASFPACIRTTRFDREHCSNGLDDTGDGLIDCAAPECADTIVCARSGEDCANGRDDDGDGLIDCEDSKCQRTSVCSPGAESCTSGADEDGDGLIDCEDPDCQGVWVCLGLVEFLGNGRDDNGNGLADCEDPTWANTSACVTGGEDCTNGIDDDGDGTIDCADVDCQFTVSCLNITELCNNGVDDNLDGLTDCEDPQCAGAAACLVVDPCTLPGSEFFAECLPAHEPPPTCPFMNGEPICLDMLCAGEPACQPLPMCSLVEGEPNCDDPLCNTEPACQPPPVCPIINGEPDCDDPLCSNELACQPPPTCSLMNGEPDCSDPLCMNELACVECAVTTPSPLNPAVLIPDDCTDPACLNDPRCVPGPEVCGDGVDNDGDGLTDCEDWVTCGQTAACDVTDCADPITGNELYLDGDLVISGPNTVSLNGQSTTWSTIPRFTVIRGALIFQQDAATNMPYSPPIQLNALRCIRAPLGSPSTSAFPGGLKVESALQDVRHLQRLSRAEGSVELFMHDSATATLRLNVLREVGQNLTIRKVSAVPLPALVPRIELVRNALLVQSQQGMPTPAVSFEGLSNLHTIGGTLELRGLLLRSGDNFTGFGQLTSVNNIFFNNVYNLESFAGLSALTQMTGWLFIIGASGPLQDFSTLNLTSGPASIFLDNVSDIVGLSGMEHLTSIGTIEIQNCPALTGLTGFDNLTQSSGTIRLNNLPQLTDASGLDGLTGVALQLLLSDLPLLTSLNLPLVNEIGILSGSANQGEGLILDHTGLTTLNGLSGLTRLNGSTRIEQNLALTSINRLASVSVSQFSSITVRDNPALSTCSVLAVRDTLRDPPINFPGMFTQSNNLDDTPCPE